MTSERNETNYLKETMLKKDEKKERKNVREKEFSCL